MTHSRSPLPTRGVACRRVREALRAETLHPFAARPIADGAVRLAFSCVAGLRLQDTSGMTRRRARRTTQQKELFVQAKALRFGEGFRVVFGNARAQAAEMVIAPGDREGNPRNLHAGADQWLFVVSGTGEARVNGKRRALKKGVLVLIERGDRHEIRATGRTPLRTLNFYAPPAYKSNGEPLPRGKPASG